MKLSTGKKRKTETAKNTAETKAPAWPALFEDYGFRRSAAPKDPPPRDRSWGNVLDWVTQGDIEDDRASSLAIAIWTGKVDPLTYAPQLKQDTAASSKATPREEQPQPDGTSNKRRRFKSRRRSQEADSAPAMKL